MDDMQELEKISTDYSNRLAVLRWFARIWASVVVAFVSVFLLIHLLGAVGGLSSLGSVFEVIRFLCFPVGLVAGLLIGWRAELWGGLLTVGSIVGFHLANVAVGNTAPFDWLITSFAFPGVLYLLSAALQRSKSNEK
ncbi:MAG: hypothetical protein HKO64_01985 [Xanthomonadales bacterium]|nr:hypothetical protein [Gammaproteobacteria bacterium]NNE05607.1 hypothetical protein [Xanthomonadales bacterium]NNL94371.1 hypothetical protein [Xanthomonadales bacterium]